MSSGGWRPERAIVAAGQFFDPRPRCFWDIEPLNGTAVLSTISHPGMPDSVRVWIGHNQRCFRSAVSLGCSSADGCCFDISLGFADISAATQLTPPPA